MKHRIKGDKQEVSGCIRCFFMLNRHKILRRIIWVSLFLFLLLPQANAQIDLELVLTFTDVGTSVATADLNGDGAYDFIIADHLHDQDRGRVSIIKGGMDLDSLPDLTLTGQEPQDLFGRSLASAGDVNGDGYDDLLVAKHYSELGLGQGAVYLYFGGLSFIDSTFLFLPGPEGWGIFGYSVAGAGDVNGDGYDDFIVGDYSMQGRAFLYFGGAPPDTIPDLIFEGVPPEGCGVRVAGAGDVNGDGYDDVLVGFPYNCFTKSFRVRARLYFGAAEMDSIADVVFKYEHPIAIRVCGVGDVNNDGFDDILIGTPAAWWEMQGEAGFAYLYFGGTEVDTIPDWKHSRYVGNDAFGHVVSSAGDLNADGFNDFMVSMAGGHTAPGIVNFYLGGNEVDTLSNFQLMGGDTHIGIDLTAAPGYGSQLTYILVSGVDHINDLQRVYLYTPVVTSVSDSISPNTPVIPAVFQNYPNPFNAETTISYVLSSRQLQSVSIKIYNILGDEIKTLVQSHTGDGTFRAIWDGRNDNGEQVSSGIYLAQLKIDSFVYVKKLVLLK